MHSLPMLNFNDLLPDEEIYKVIRNAWEPIFVCDCETRHEYELVTGHSISSLLHARGCHESEQGNFPAALQLLYAAWKRSIHPATLREIGICYMRMGRFHDAVMPLAGAVSLWGLAQPRLLLAQTFVELKEFGRAADMALSALERNPGYRKALAILDHPKVQEHFLKVFETWPKPEEWGPNHDLARLRALGLDWRKGETDDQV